MIKSVLSFRCVSRLSKMNSKQNLTPNKSKSRKNKNQRNRDGVSSPFVQTRTVSFHHPAHCEVNCVDLAKLFGTVVRSSRDEQQSWIRSNVEMKNEKEANCVVKSYAGSSLPPGVTSVAILGSKVNADQKNKRKFFNDHWSDREVESGLKAGKVHLGQVRINPRKYQHAFVNEMGAEDILIDGMADRNRALGGDEVAYVIKPRDQWVQFGLSESTEDGTQRFKSEDKEAGKLRRTAFVVKIMKENHPRVATGIFKSQPKDGLLTFSPHSNIFPRMVIPRQQVENDLMKADFSKILYIAEIVKWNSGNPMPLGKLVESIGEAGELEAETRRILVDYGVESSEFGGDVNNCLPGELPWSIPQSERAKRRDFTHECIFSIDPSSARDLDDALHCTQLSNGSFEVGVHIADVSYFIAPRCALDVEAGQRCTSVYMVQRVVPMLPRLLCEELCSLNPGVERLTFSVVWNVTAEGKILSEWFGRSIIKSCSKLSYDHAQSFIDDPHRNFLSQVPQQGEFPDIFGGFPLTEIRTKVLQLFKISQHLRNRRFKNGALKLDQVKLSYTLNPDSGQPMGCYAYQYKQSNALIEEFMLLANIAVAHKIHKSFPGRAFLRSHPKPKQAMMDEVVNHCKAIGLDLDATTSGALSTSISTLSSGDYAAYRQQVLFYLAIRPQKLATYICAGSSDDQSDYHHYALNVPLYTHFTSPIRRYADVIVHRQLAAALGDTSAVSAMQMTANDLQSQAELCNLKKSTSKACQDQSIELFFNAMVNSMGYLESKGIVLYVHSKRVDVLSIEYGVTARIGYNVLPILGYSCDEGTDTDKELQIKTVTLNWPKEDKNILELENLNIEDKNSIKDEESFEQQLKAFTIVDLIFKKKEPSNPHSVHMSIKKPESKNYGNENAFYKE